MTTELRADGELVVIAGASRSGKTLLAVDVTRRAERMLVWDVEGQWPRLAGCNPARSRAELVRLARDRRVHRISYTPPPPPPPPPSKKPKPTDAAAWLAAEFAFFCSVAWLWLMVGPCFVIVEEISDVTTPAKAPAEYGVLVRRGMKYGLHLIPITQRPAESDKTSVGNASKLVTFRMSREADELYISRELRVDQSRVAALKPLHYLERDMRTGAVREGIVKIRTRRKGVG